MSFEVFLTPLLYVERRLVAVLERVQGGIIGQVRGPRCCAPAPQGAHLPAHVTPETGTCSSKAGQLPCRCARRTEGAPVPLAQQRPARLHAQRQLTGDTHTPPTPSPAQCSAVRSAPAEEKPRDHALSGRAAAADAVVVRHHRLVHHVRVRHRPLPAPVQPEPAHAHTLRGPADCRAPRRALPGAVLLQEHAAGALCVCRQLVDVDEAAEAREERGRAAVAPGYAGRSVRGSLQDIYIARAEGELALEEELYWALISIYRSPAVMFELTARGAVRKKDA